MEHKSKEDLNKKPQIMIEIDENQNYISQTSSEVDKNIFDTNNLLDCRDENSMEYLKLQNSNESEQQSSELNASNQYSQYSNGPYSSTPQKQVNRISITSPHLTSYNQYRQTYHHGNILHKYDESGYNQAESYLYQNRPLTSLHPSTLSSNEVSPENTSVCETSKDETVKKKFVLIGPSEPSLRIIVDFDPFFDAKAIHKAITKFTCDENTIFKILAHRSSAQREHIKDEYKKLFGKCLIKTTKKKIIFPLKPTMEALLYFGAEQDAFLLRKSIKGVGTYDDILIQIICTRSSAQLFSIKEAYKKMYGKTLVETVKDVTSGNYKKLLIYLIENPRKEDDFDIEAACGIADSIFQKDILNTYAPECLIEKLCSCSLEQLIEINKSFNSKFSMPLHKYLKSYTVGNYRDSLITICYYHEDSINYFAKFLKKSIQYKSINGVNLVICTRCEIDLNTISLAYFTNYKRHLIQDIKWFFFNTKYVDRIKVFEMLMGLK